MTSVTTALSVIDQDYGPADKVEAAATRGTEVHSGCEAYALGLPTFSMSEEAAPYLESFIKWWDLMADAIIVEPEIELADESLGLMGHPDFPALRLKDGRLTVLDLKTPIAYRKTWSLQLGAYWGLMRSKYPELVNLEASVLMLAPNGEMAKLIWIDDPAKMFSLYMGALNLYRFMGGVK